MSRYAHGVLLTGLGVVVERPAHPGWGELMGALSRSRLGQVVAAYDPAAGTGGRDRKLLDELDRMALQAAQAAMQDGCDGAPPEGARWACVCSGTSKLTRESEVALPYTRYLKADGTPDTLAYRGAIEAGEVHVDPLGLLRCLDNNVSWWLCKNYGFGDANLQLGQSLAPDYWALLAAVDLVASGEYDGVLVGSCEGGDQSAVHLTGLYGASCARDMAPGGGACFFTLQREGSVDARRGHARLSLELKAAASASSPQEPDSLAAPGLQAALAVVRYCADAGGPKGAGGDALSVGCLRVERVG